MQKKSKKTYDSLMLWFFLLIFMSTSNAFAADISWNQVTAAGSYPVTGYKLYYGEEAGNYKDSFDVHNVTSYELDNITPSLTDGKTYFFVVVAYTSIAEEGFFSDEAAINYAAGSGSGSPISAPTNLVVVW
jgi:hypothetical protein